MVPPLNQLKPAECSRTPLQTRDLRQRAERVLQNAAVISFDSPCLQPLARLARRRTRRIQPVREHQGQVDHPASIRQDSSRLCRLLTRLETQGGCADSPTVFGWRRTRGHWDHAESEHTLPVQAGREHELRGGAWEKERDAFGGDSRC